MTHHFTIASVLIGVVLRASASPAQLPQNIAKTNRDTVQADWPSEFDAVVRAARLEPLRSVALREGKREIRVWIGSGLPYPQDLYRIVDNGNGRLAGTLIFHWPADEPDTANGEVPGKTFYDVVVHHQRGRCTNFHRFDGVAICVARFMTPPSWRTILHKAEAAGLWSLPDQASVPNDNVAMVDGWGISIELRDGKSYRAYSYSDPEAHLKWPEAKQAEAIAAAFRTVQKLVAPSLAEKVFVGIASSGPNLSEFQQCGSKVKWGFQGNLTGHSAWSARPRADTVQTGVRRELVRVRGSLALEWVSREWQSEYPRVLEVTEIISARPAKEATCE